MIARGRWGMDHVSRPILVSVPHRIHGGPFAFTTRPSASFASRSTPLLPHPTQHRPYLHILPGVTMATKTRWNRRGESQHAVCSITRGADLFPLLSGLGEEDDPSRQRPRCHDGVLAGPENTRAWLSSCHQKSPVLA